MDLVRKTALQASASFFSLDVVQNDISGGRTNHDQNFNLPYSFWFISNRITEYSKSFLLVFSKRRKKHHPVI